MKPSLEKTPPSKIPAMKGAGPNLTLVNENAFEKFLPWTRMIVPPSKEAEETEVLLTTGKFEYMKTLLSLEKVSLSREISRYTRQSEELEEQLAISSRFGEEHDILDCCIFDRAGTSHAEKLL